MANPEDKTFHCDLIDPTGKLLDCQATSVVLPAHDGQLGILYDHMPMLCQLGLGTMKVTEQIDALRSLATDPVEYLVVPRCVAAMVSLPLLTVVTPP